MKIRLFMLMLAVAALAVVGCKEKPKTAPEPKEKVEVVFHVMSQCPFGVQVEKGIKPVLDQLGKAVDFKLHFIGDEKDGALTSMHGENEVKGNLLQICAMKHAPDAYMNVIECMNKNMKEIPNNFDACATEVKVDGAKIKACADGDEGKKLLTESYKFSKEKGARGSPTIFVAGEKYSGQRKPDDFLRAICGKFKDKPEPCKNIPEPKKIAMTVLSDARCKDCMPDRILNQLKNMFPGLQPKTVDYGTPEGKQLYDSLKTADGKVLLPAFLMEPAVEQDPGFDQVKRFVKDAGQYKLLQIGAKFDPTAEICDNTTDDDGNGKVDCDDESCKEKMICRPEIKNQLEVFVMSQCPFGIKALNAMKEVLAAFDNKINFKVNFIGDEKDGKLTSMHGQGEVDENIRELCAIKYYGKDYKYMDYVLCRNADIKNPDWKKCAVNGIDAAKIEKCSTTDEGTKMMTENIKIAKSLGIGASPTWVANNKVQFSGIAAEQIKQQFCAANKDLKGCEKTLSSDAKGPAGGCGSN